MFLDTPRRPSRSAFFLILLASVWLAVFGNVALWRSLTQLPDLKGWHGLLFGAAFALIIASATTALLSLLAWRWTLKPAISLLLLLAAFATYYMLMYGIVVDTPMVTNVFQTDAREARDQLSWRLGVTVLFLAVLPMIWLWRQPTTYASIGTQVMRNVLLCVAALTVTLGTTQLVFQDFASLMRNHTQLRYQINPLNSVYALLDLTVVPSDQPSGPLQPLGVDAHITPRTGAAQHPPLLLFVLGETARSANFSLNGYARLTNPLLAKENVTSFTQVASCGTSTAESVPCMFSHLGREGYAKRSHDFENWLDVLQRAGYAVLWMDNQSGCKGQCDRIPNLNTSELKLPDQCEDGECRDTVMLTQLDKELAKLPSERRARGTVVVMHQMGSHGPAYFKRTPAAFKPFVPECTDTSLSQCNQAQVVNAYDNTLVFTDYFLSRAIGWLKDKEKTAATALFYVADHGESLGENNLYLHGLPYAMAPAEQKQVPLITWLSPTFETQSRIKTSCLQKQRDRALSHDHLFHSVLGLMAVKTEVYQPTLDLFADCANR
ncbi:phosphoethanolamine transferase [Limnohabitans sp. TS-CS-82]|uniref:phosphoethanolamine transferase n=1 Tax=Limnohabitans sp. TS-CS-82 TaxID=2094193 RepID=UPI000CF2B154|nr:phosphoethanolamine--lipid A transferase [Limnohabitans sp. TS-CS-82]PQA83392.1 phosphoethanolamine transferase [Limnohabitans sp. TS-CS-82]